MTAMEYAAMAVSAMQTSSHFSLLLDFSEEDSLPITVIILSEGLCRSVAILNLRRSTSVTAI